MTTPIFSIIIPHKDSPQQLFRLVETLPDGKDWEVIIVDDHSSTITLAELKTLSEKANDINLQVVQLPEDRNHAGAARNVGLALARGKWLLFADADDYFLPDMPRIVASHKDDDADLIFFHTECVNPDTHQTGIRHLRFNAMLDAYTSNSSEETLNSLRCGFTPPWSKLYRHEFIKQHGIQFDEVKASNDIMFSLQAALNAQHISIDPRAIYCVTENNVGLTKNYSREAWYSRLRVALRANQLMRHKGMAAYQYAIPRKSFKSSQYGLRDVWIVCSLLWRYRQNPFAGLLRKYKERGSVKAMFSKFE